MLMVPPLLVLAEQNSFSASAASINHNCFCVVELGKEFLGCAFFLTLLSIIFYHLTYLTPSMIKIVSMTK